MKARKVAFVSDIHAPYHDPSAVELTLKILADAKPDVLFFGGDIADCYAVSDFDRDPQRVVRFQDELDSAIAIMSAMRGLAKNALFLPGNHESRWSGSFTAIPSCLVCATVRWLSSCSYGSSVSVC